MKEMDVLLIVSHKLDEIDALIIENPPANYAKIRKLLEEAWQLLDEQDLFNFMAATPPPKGDDDVR